MASAALLLVAVGLAACDAGPGAVSDPTCLASPADGEVCDLDALADRFRRCLRLRAGACVSCHDATAPEALLKAPGPPWLYPDDAAATVRAILALGLVSARAPTTTSLLVLKPSGAVSHTGGVHFSLDGQDGAPWVRFVAWAAPCVTGR